MSDTQRVRNAFDKAASSYAAAAALQREVSSRLAQRLDYIKLKPQRVLDLGAGVGISTGLMKQRYPGAEIIAVDFALGMLAELKKNAGFFRKPVPVFRKPIPVCADASALPFADNSFELIFSSLTLQWCPDIKAVFAECLRVLKPGGLLLFSTLGPDTLKELRASWEAVDRGMHVNRFLDMHDVGDALLAAGFGDPVMDNEYLTLTYKSVLQLLRELKLLGANTVLGDQPNRLTGRQHFQAMQDAYRDFCTEPGVYPASYEVVYGLGWGRDLNVQQMHYTSLNDLV